MASTDTTAAASAPDGTRFIDGVVTRGKLIGVEDVKEETGDEMCNTCMIKLKAVVIAKKEHKLPILIKISFDGLTIIDAKTNEVLYKHAVEHISYISRDPTDPRAFGYIFKNDKNQLQYLAIKTQFQAADVVLTLKDLFEVVYEKSQKEKAKAKEAKEEKKSAEEPIVEQTTGTLFDIEEPAVIVEAPVDAPPIDQPVVTINPPPKRPNIPKKEVDLFQVEEKKDDILDFLDGNSSSMSKSPSSAPASADLFALNLTPDKFSSLSSTVASPPNSLYSTSPQIPPINLVGSPFKNQLGSPVNQFLGVANYQQPPQLFQQPPQPQQQQRQPQLQQQKFAGQLPQLQQFQQQPPQPQFSQQQQCPRPVFPQQLLPSQQQFAQQQQFPTQQQFLAQQPFP